MYQFELSLWLSPSCLLERLECLKIITLIQAHFLPLMSDICRQAAAGFQSLLKSLKSFKSGRKICDKSVIMGTVLTSIFSKCKERNQTAVLCVAACGRGVERMTFERVFVWEPVMDARALKGWVHADSIEAESRCWTAGLCGVTCNTTESRKHHSRFTWARRA